MAPEKRKFEDDVDIFNRSWSVTEPNKVKCQHVWTIGSFKFLESQTEVGESVNSALFSVKVEDSMDKPTLTFRMKAYLNGRNSIGSNYVAVFLHNENNITLHIGYDIFIQYPSGGKNHTLLRSKKGGQKFVPKQGWGADKVISKTKLMEHEKQLMPLNQLTLGCNLEIYYGDQKTLAKKPKINLKPVQTLADNMGELLADQTFSDITLIASDKTRFPCHKNILSARSTVFTAMFSHKEASENKTNEVLIEDINSDVLEKLIEFIYTDQVQNGLPGLASGLLSAADKYDILQLKVLCEDTMCSNINVNNVSNMLVLGHLHEAKNLQSMAVDFVLKHMQSVRDTPDWQEIRKKHPAIVDKVLMTLMQNN